MVHGILGADGRKERGHRRRQRQSGQSAAQARPTPVDVLAGEVFVGVLGVLARLDHGADEALHDVLLQKLGGQIVVATGQLEHGHDALLGERIVDLGGDRLQIRIGHELAEHKVNGTGRIGGHLLGHVIDARQIDIERFGERNGIGAAAERVQFVLDLAAKVLGRDVLLAVNRIDDIDQLLFDEQVDHLDAVGLGESG